MLRGITIRFARRISFRSKEFRGVDHRRKGKKLSARSLGMERLVRIEQVVSSLRLQWRRSGVHSNIAVIRASVNVTKYNRTHELPTRFMIIGWDARRESGRLSLLIDEEKATTDPSERFEKNKRKKNKKEKEEGTGIYIRCYRENFIVVGDRTTVAQLSSTRVRPRFHFFFFFSPRVTRVSRARSKGCSERPARQQCTEKVDASCTEQTRKRHALTSIPVFSNPVPGPSSR